MSGLIGSLPCILKILSSVGGQIVTLMGNITALNLQTVLNLKLEGFLRIIVKIIALRESQVSEVLSDLLT